MTRLSTFDGTPCGCADNQRCIDCATDAELSTALKQGLLPVEDLGDLPRTADDTPGSPA
jgi:hypothetical protein